MTDQEIQSLAQGMIGTCRVIEEELSDLSYEQCLLFDSIVFCCDACGWWCDTSEANDNESMTGFLCDECYEKEK